MSAIDELQRMLDEREVDHSWTDLRRSVPSCEIVQWWSSDDVHAEYIEYHDGSTVLRIHTSMLHATPEQAIAATLGDADAIKTLRDYLSKSPSVVYPQDVLEYLPAIEAENAKLRKLCSDMWIYITEPVSKRHNLKERFARFDDIGDLMRELGIEVDA